MRRPRRSARRRLKAGTLALVSIMLAWSWPSWALAHVAEAGETHRWSWSFEPLPVVLLLAAGVIYGRGLARLWRRAGIGRAVRPAEAACFTAGLATLAVALLSPLDTAAAQRLWAHMIQHLVLMVLSAPLLVLAAPLPALVAGLPSGWGRALARWWSRRRLSRALWRRASGLLPAFLLQTAVLWAWHLPAPYDAALSNELIHDLEHASLFGAALLFWWAVAHSCRGAANPLLGALALFATMAHSGLLAALMTFAPTAWYAGYAQDYGGDLTPIGDQQIAGLIMWVPGGMFYLVAGLILMARCLVDTDPAAARRHAEAGEARVASIIAADPS